MTPSLTPGAPAASDAQLREKIAQTIEDVLGEGIFGTKTRAVMLDCADALLSGPIAEMQAEHQREVEKLVADNDILRGQYSDMVEDRDRLATELEQAQFELMTEQRGAGEELSMLRRDLEAAEAKLDQYENRFDPPLGAENGHG